MVRIETKRAAPIPHGGRSLVAVARTVRAAFPRGRGGLVWTRPIGIEVDEAGQRRFLPIPDPTRRIQWLLLGGGAVAALLLRRSVRSRRFRGRRP